MLVAVLILWYQDHLELVKQLEIRNGVQGLSWSIDQVLGPPDTRRFGDFGTAWASRSMDSGDEIIVVEFPQSVAATAVQIVETYNPGAVVKVFSVSATGAELLVWEGVDPLGSNVAGGNSTIPFKEPVSTRRLKIVLASAEFAGWNEIDAVGLVDQHGSCHWASAAWASSSYGANREIPMWFWP